MYQILIVDDEKIERRGIRFLLNRMGNPFEISEASNGKAALEWLSEHSADILLTDIKMPFMDGITLIGEVSRSGQEMKKIIFSGYNEFEYARTAMKYGVENYILKPVNPEEFEETMQKMIRELDQEREEAKKREEQLRFLKEHYPFDVQNLEQKQEAEPAKKAGEAAWELRKKEREKKAPLHREVEMVEEYIYKNYEKELGIDSLAEMVHLAPAYLSTLFKKETGQNLSKFIKSVRMECAQEMLGDPLMKIVDISTAVGYANVSYFCQSFREYFGVSPQKYRSGGDSEAEPDNSAEESGN